jgi:hypothetical protein
LSVTVDFVLFATTARAQDAQAPQVPADPAVTNPSNNATNSSSNVTNASNNPVTPKPQILLQNFLMPSPHGFQGRPGDEELLRLICPHIPAGRYQCIMGVPNATMNAG